MIQRCHERQRVLDLVPTELHGKSYFLGEEGIFAGEKELQNVTK